nr:reverse transcriptase domain-containing protein [Tanacetum cinerariifolium]
MLTLRTAEVDMVKNDEALEIILDLLEEKREDEAIQEAKSKAKMEKYYNARGRNTSFKPGNLIYQNNEASHAEDGGKLRPKWEAPYEVTKALGKGSYKLRDRNGEHPAANLKRLEVANSSSSKVTVGGSTSFGSVSITWSLKIERGGTTPEDVKVIERVVMGLVVTGVAKIGVIRVRPYSTTASTSFSSIDFSLSSSTSTCLLKWTKLVDAILLSASAFLFSHLASNLNLRAYVNSIPSGLISIKPTLEPSIHDDPSVNNVYGSGSSFLSSMGVSGGSSSGPASPLEVLMASLAAARYMTNSSFSFGAVSIGLVDILS